MFSGLKRGVRTFLWNKMNVHWKLNTDIGVVIRNDNDWYVFNEIFTNGEYDPVFELMGLSPKNLIVIDLGANVGYFSLRVSDYLIQKGKEDFNLFSFEASRLNYVELERRLTQTHLKSRVITVHGLVGKKSGQATLSTDTDHFGFKVDESKNGGELASYVNIENYLGKYARVDLLKCDIEGSELEFVENYQELLSRTRLAVFEFHASVCDVQRCRTLIKSYGLEYVSTLRENDTYKTSVEIFKRDSEVLA